MDGARNDRVTALALSCLASGCGNGPVAPRDAGAPDAPTVQCADEPAGLQWPTFHGNNARWGWNDRETVLTPAAVASVAFGHRWDSNAFDRATVMVTRTDGTTVPTAFDAHAFASPLYTEGLAIRGGTFDHLVTGAVFVATTNAFVYALAPRDANCGGRAIRAGDVLWRTKLATPAWVEGLDGGLPLGVLGTPVLDLASSPPRLFVSSLDQPTPDQPAHWSVFALDARSGATLEGWPVLIDNDSVGRVNHNGPAEFLDARVHSQRAALTLSADGRTLYVPFGAYTDHGIGWLVAIDTGSPRVAQAFSGAPATGDLARVANGGMWGPGGVAIDAQGRVFATTGNSPEAAGDRPANPPGFWGQSLLAWSDDLTLAGTYTPFNYCDMDRYDIDLGGSSPVLIDLDPSESSTPRVAAFGGKQGNVYLVDRDDLPGSLIARPPCGTDPARDGSLLAPQPQPQFGTRGPLNVFGPYDSFGNYNFAKMRSTPAYFHDAAGHHLFVTGSTHDPDEAVAYARDVFSAPGVIPPSVARLGVVTTPGAPAYVSIERSDGELSLLNPGSPVVSSEGPSSAVIWVLDANAVRLARFDQPDFPHPMLYALDGATLEVLYRTPSDQLFVGGKYGTPLVARGTVFVATDRLQAFGLAPH